MPVVDSLTFPDKLGEGCVKLIDKWMGGEHAAANESFEAGEYLDLPSKLKIHFLDALYTKCTQAEKPPLIKAAITKMDGLYQLTASKNSEARLRWQRLCILHRMDFIVPHVIEFVKEQGRMKFVRPLYRDLYGWEEKRSIAVETFEGWRENYHPIAAKMLASDLKLTGE